MFSLLRSSRVAVGRALAAKPAYTPARSFTAPAWSKGAHVGNVTPYTAAATLVSARARFFETSRASAFAAHAPAAGKTKSAGGAKKGGAKKASAAKKGTKASAKKKGTKAVKAKGGKARTAATERGRGRPKKAKKDVPPKIFKKELTPPFKAPGSGWTNFVAEFVRAKAKADGTPVPVALVEASKVWREMTPEVRAKYSPSRESIAEYQAKKVEWFKSLPLSHRRKYRQTHKQPTRGGKQTPFSLFTKDNFSHTDGATFGERATKVAQMWRDLSESEKEAYRQRCSEYNQAHKESQASASESAPASP